jgi:hypothetical protein
MRPLPVLSLLPSLAIFATLFACLYMLLVAAASIGRTVCVVVTLLTAGCSRRLILLRTRVFMTLLAGFNVLFMAAATGVVLILIRHGFSLMVD